MLIQSCPAESDARDKVAQFVSDPKTASIGGLRTDGLDFLKELVLGQLRTQEPGSRIIELDRDYLGDNGIDFARDLARKMDEETSKGDRVNWIVVQDLPVMDWQKALERLNGRDTQVFLFTNACRQVPCCFKLVNQ